MGPAELAAADVMVLMSLAPGPKHGYAIMSDILAFAGVRIGPGTLYTALERLERDGLIVRLAAEGRRRPYRITTTGLAAIRARAADMRRLTAVATRRLATR